MHGRKLHAGYSKEEEKPVAITIHFWRPPQLAASFVSTADSPMSWPRSTGHQRPANRNHTGGLLRVTEGRSASVSALVGAGHDPGDAAWGQEQAAN